jgi:hypothetical protein
MVLPEDSGAAYERVCDQIGYDTIGIPETEDDVEKFEEYRKKKQLGSIIVAYVPHNILNQHEVSLGHLCTKTCCRRSLHYLHQLLNGTRH